VSWGPGVEYEELVESTSIYDLYTLRPWLPTMFRRQVSDGRLSSIATQPYYITQGKTGEGFECDSLSLVPCLFHSDFEAHRSPFPSTPRIDLPMRRGRQY